MFMGELALTYLPEMGYLAEKIKSQA